MPWAEVSVRVTRGQVPEVEELLLAAGALAITLEDPADDPVLEPAPGAVPLWPEVRIRGLFEDNVDQGAVLAILLDGGPIERASQSNWRRVEDQDWERAWLDRFQPMCFGRRLWIVPTGTAPRVGPDAIQLKLDPGLAFGTGTHPTTAMCLQWIDGAALDGCSVLDFGCGSGVLGVAAALCGAHAVVAVDNDPQALVAAAQNAERNGVGDRIEVLAADAWHERPLADRSVDVVLANILAGPLVELAPQLLAVLRPGGQVILSGILEHQALAVSSAYQPGCAMQPALEREGWVRLNGIRQDKP